MAVEQESQELEVHITSQTFNDLGMWLTYPEQHRKEQLHRLMDDDLCLPVVTLANNYWLIGALTNSLQASRVWQQLPEQLTDYLTEVTLLYLQRSGLVMQESIHACSLLTKANIPVVILKGAASLFNGTFKPISSRYMCDVDLLVNESHQAQAQQILLDNDYSQYIDEFDVVAVNHHHNAPLLRKGSQYCIELHRLALKNTSSEVLATDEIWQQAVALKLNDDIEVLQVEPTQQVILSIAHSEMSHNGFAEKHLDLRQYLNLYALVKHYHQQLDWQTIEQHFARAGQLAILQATLYSLWKLFNLSTPLTDEKSKVANKHFETCISLYCNHNTTKQAMYHFKRLLNGYSKQSILLSYGETGKFPVTAGRIKHFKRHLQMAFIPKYLKRFINRTFY